MAYSSCQDYFGSPNIMYALHDFDVLATAS